MLLSLSALESLDDARDDAFDDAFDDERLRCRCSSSQRFHINISYHVDFQVSFYQ